MSSVSTMFRRVSRDMLGNRMLFITSTASDLLLCGGTVRIEREGRGRKRRGRNEDRGEGKRRGKKRGRERVTRERGKKTKMSAIFQQSAELFG